MTTPPKATLESALASPDFQISTFLEQADCSQQGLAELALQLQLQTQNCHDEIGRIGAELQAVLPRCAADVGRVGTTLASLEKDCEQLIESNKSVAVPSESTASLETLSTLHILQAKLQAVKDILMAEDSWDATLQSIADSLAQQNVSAAVKSLATLEHGVSVLQGMQDADDKLEHYEKIKSSVLAMLHPQLQGALKQSRGTSALQNCVGLYGQLHQIDIVINEYVKHRPMAIHKLWFDFDADFKTWLPKWLDSVQYLVAEEMRQIASIFGNAHVASISVQILRECFRPIVPSFTSRLRLNDLDTVSATYESMCQFLSLTYETIVASCTANDQLDDLQAVLPFTVSSYIEYQTKLSTCEAKYFEEKGRALTKDIQAAAMSLSATEDQGGFVDVIQTASEQLQALATSTFPMAEGAVARMELLSGGYDAQSVLTVVDSQVSTVAKEVALSVHKLCLLDIEFDEAIVLASLSVLKIAGTFRKSLDTLESKTHQRCSLMRDRIVKYSPPKLTDFMMSAVEVDTFLTRKVCCKDLQTSLDSLQTLADSKFVFQKTREQCQRLAASCHEFVFHVCGSVPRLQLAKISSLGSWSSSAKVGDDTIDYGTLPQEYITHVGEHMLSLVQALEPFATDRDALELANHAMEGSKEVALGSWTDFCSSVNGQEKLVPRLIESKTFEGYVLGAHLEEEDEQETERDEDENKAVTVFCNAWLEAIGTAVTGRLLERIMRIPLLTTKGSDQLCADLQYLINVLTALGVSELPHPLLGHLAELSTLETELLEQRIESMDRSDDISNFVWLVESRLLAMRQRH